MYCGLVGSRNSQPTGRAEVDDVEQQCPGGAQAALDVEGAVHARIVDQALPADGGARLLEVHPHDDLEPVGVLVGQRREPPRVVERGNRIVDRARPDDDEQSVVAAGEDVGDLVAVTGDGNGPACRQRQFAAQRVRRRDRSECPDAPIRRRRVRMQVGGGGHLIASRVGTGSGPASEP